MTRTSPWACHGQALSEGLRVSRWGQFFAKLFVSHTIFPAHLDLQKNEFSTLNIRNQAYSFNKKSKTYLQNLTKSDMARYIEDCINFIALSNTTYTKRETLKFNCFIFNDFHERYNYHFIMKFKLRLIKK